MAFNKSWTFEFYLGNISFNGYNNFYEGLKR